MKLTDSIINKFGADKVMHFFIACSVTALVSPFGLLAVGITAAVIMILELVKEIFLDDEFSWGDVLATLLGILPTILLNSLLYAIGS